MVINMELIKINFIKHPTGQLARHEIYRKKDGRLTGVVIPLPVDSEHWENNYNYE